MRAASSSETEKRDQRAYPTYFAKAPPARAARASGPMGISRRRSTRARSTREVCGTVLATMAASEEVSVAGTPSAKVGGGVAATGSGRDLMCFVTFIGNLLGKFDGTWCQVR